MKKTLALILAIVMALGCMSITAFAEVSGEGTEANPYLASMLEVGDVFSMKSYIKNDKTSENLAFGNGMVFCDIGPGEVKTVSLTGYSDDSWLKVVGLGGDLSSGTIYIEETTAPAPNNKADITGTITPEDFGYTMVIPTATVLTQDNHTGVEVGQAKVKNVAHPTDGTVIYYTATTTDLTSEDGTAITTGYYTEAACTTAFPTTAVVVYENKADAASIPTMYVNVTDANWDAAPVGSYTATVTFNFGFAERTVLVEQPTLSEVLATVPGGFPTTEELGWIDMTGQYLGRAYIRESYIFDCNWSVYYPSSVMLSRTEDGNYSFLYSIDSGTMFSFTLVMDRITGVLSEIHTDGYIFVSQSQMTSKSVSELIGDTVYAGDGCTAGITPAQQFEFANNVGLLLSIPADTAVLNFGDRYSYNDGTSGASYHFNMNGDDCVSITRKTPWGEATLLPVVE